MAPNRERVWVGLFVVIAAAVLAVTAVAVWGGMSRDGATYRAYFTFSGGVQPGAPVRYGGLRVGRVQSVRVDPEDSSRIELVLMVDPGTPIKVDSVARPSSLGPLSDNYIEISTGAQNSALASPGSVLKTSEPFGLAQLGDSVQALLPQIERVLDKFTVSLDQLQLTLGRADDLLNERNRANLEQALVQFKDALNDANRAKLADSISRLDQMLKDSEPKVSTALTRLSDATGRFNPLLDDITKTSAHADQVLSSFESLVTENRPDLRASVTELRAVLTQSTEAMNQLQRILDQNGPNLDEIVDNLRQSAENIRTLSESVKSNPSTLILGVNARDRKPGDAR